MAINLYDPVKQKKPLENPPTKVDTRGRWAYRFAQGTIQNFRMGP